MHRVALLLAAACVAFPASTSGAALRTYTFDSGTKKERETVVAALDASSFDWTLLPGSLAIHIVHGQPSRSIPHEIWLDADLLRSGEFAWGVVQHEFGHQVDYLLLDDAERAQLLHVRRPRLVLRRAWARTRPVRLRAFRVDLCLVVLALPAELHASDSSRRRVGSDEAGEVSCAGHTIDQPRGEPQLGAVLMPGWLMWTLVGLGAWIAASVPLAFLAGRLLRHERKTRRRVIVLAGPGSIRVRV